MSLLLTAGPAVPGNLPLTIFHRAQARRIPHIRAKMRVRANPQFFTVPTPPFPNFPEQIRHQAQKRRIPIIKGKRPLRSNLVPARLGRGGVPQFPIIIRHGQKKRGVSVKVKKALRANLGVVRVGQSPFPSFPIAERHPRGQTKRIARVKPKRIVRSNIELRITQTPPTILPLAVFGHRRGRKAAQKRRVVVHKYNSLLSLIPTGPVTVSTDAIIVWRERGGY